MELQEVTRELLYEQVWQAPMTQIAEKYGVSSSYLARVCDRLGVPRPERGYWAKISAGKNVSVPALPKAKPDHELVWPRSGLPNPVPNIVTPEPYGARKTVKTNCKLKDIPATHPLLRGARELFLKGWETGNGYLKPRKWNLVDIITSRGSLDSALATANTLFLEFYRRSWTVKLEPPGHQFRRPEVDERPKGGEKRYGVEHWSPGRSTIVYVGTVAIGLTLIEDSERTEMAYIKGKYVPVKNLSKDRIASTWTTYQDLPSGQFRLRAYSAYYRTNWQQEWSIKENQDLVKLAKRVSADLKKATGDIAEQYAIALEQIRNEQQEWQEWKDRRRIEEEESLRKDSLKKSTEALERLISEWGKAKEIEGFFSLLQEKVESAPEHEKEYLVDRLEEARKLMKAPDVLQILKGWQTPEERYEARKNSKNRF